MDNQAKENLVLKITEESDLDNILTLWNDGNVMRYVGFPNGLGYDRAKITDWFKSIMQTKRFIHYSIYTENGVYCGETGYAEGRKRDGNMGIDIKLMPEAQGKGIAEFAVRFIINHIRNHNIAESVWVDPHRDNAKALKLYTKLGFAVKEFPDYLSDEDDGEHIYMELSIC
ncbi:MAG: GNAT family N-acetyltransferase [Candidatus Cloacimonetes bacterium]|nr:GNAT family N-acetyltransferase [Candidatus Cloacimonadota bacterium]